MATLKQRLHRKNASGTYDTVHFESSSDLILRPSGRTVEQDLADYLPEVQANDNVPESLQKLVIGTTRGFIRGKQLATSDDLSGKANTSHTHTASQITAGTLNTNVMASNVATASARLRNIQYSTTALTPGTSALTNGLIYLVYV